MVDPRDETEAGEETTTDTEQEEEYIAAPLQTPGEMLAQAREAANLALEDVAVQTRLSRSVLEAVENDNYGQLGEPVYVRGYLRRYARLVSLPEEDVLQAHEAVSGMSAPVPTPPHLDLANEPLYPSHNWLPLVTLLVIGCLLVAAIIWWTRQPGPRIPFPSQPAAEGVGQPVKSGSRGASDIQTATPPVSLLSVPSEPAQNRPDALVGPLRFHGGRESAPSKPKKKQDRPQKTGKGAGASVAATAGGAKSAAASPAGKVEQEKAAQTATGPVALHLSFDHKCWVNIHDATGKILMLGMAHAGQSSTLRGKPPYNVVLGYASGVTMTFGGKPVDVAKHAGDGEVARFTVGEPTGEQGA